MIHEEVSHLSSLPCWAECINPAAFRVAVLNLSSFKHITSCCRWLSACFKIELFIFTTNWNGNSLTLQLPLHLGCIKTICDLVTVLKSWFHNHKGLVICKQSICRLLFSQALTLLFLLLYFLFLIHGLCAQIVTFANSTSSRFQAQAFCVLLVNAVVSNCAC